MNIIFGKTGTILMSVSVGLIAIILIINLINCIIYAIRYHREANALLPTVVTDLPAVDSNDGPYVLK
jgi:hypothetical protein